MTVDPQNRADLIAERAAAATKGPWAVEFQMIRSSTDTVIRSDDEFGNEAWSSDADAEFIANARDDIPWLLERLAQSERDLTAAQERWDRHERVNTDLHRVCSELQQKLSEQVANNDLEPDGTWDCSVEGPDGCTIPDKGRCTARCVGEEE